MPREGATVHAAAEWAHAVDALPWPAAVASVGREGVWRLVAANSAFADRVRVPLPALDGADLREVVDAGLEDDDVAPAAPATTMAATIRGRSGKASDQRDAVTLTLIALGVSLPGRLYLVALDAGPERGTAQELRRIAERWRGLFEHSSDVSFMLDPDGRLLDVNPAGERLLQIPRDVLLSCHFLDLVDTPEHEAVGLAFARVLAGTVVTMEVRAVTGDGDLLDLDVLALPLLEDGVTVGVYGVARDITARKGLERQLEESEQQHRSLFEDNVDAVLTFDLDGRFTHLNSATEALMGFTSQELLGTSFLPHIVPELREFTLTEFHKVLEGRPVQYETAMHARSGDVVELHVTVIPIEIDGRIQGIHCIGKDITGPKRLERELSQMAYLDVLTGLPNYHALIALLTHLVEAARPFAVLAIDLDRFKAVNDTWGRETGDHLLVAVGQRVSHALPDGVQLCRYSGDGFVLTVERRDGMEAMAIAERVRDVLRQPIMVDEHEVAVTATMGISLFPEDGGDVGTQIKKAESALFAAKRTGRNRVALYSEVATPEDERTLGLELHLRHALRKGELALVFQPYVDVSTRVVRGAEALVRWHSPELGTVGPDEFIPVAEDSGLIVDIGRWVLERACEELATWPGRGWDEMAVAINISMHQFYDDSFVDQVESIILRTGVDASRVVLEVTESIASRADVGVRLTELKRLGVRIAIDDFGTGYSSLQYLRDFPLDLLKIDRAFIARVEDNCRDRDLVSAIIGLARSFGLRTVAEGVETESQAAALESLGADFAQGYHFARPMAPDALRRWVAERHP